MRKRIIGCALSAMLLALSYPSAAQQAKKVHRIGYLSAGSSSEAPRLKGFREGLRQLG